MCHLIVTSKHLAYCVVRWVLCVKILSEMPFEASTCQQVYRTIHFTPNELGTTKPSVLFAGIPFRRSFFSLSLYQSRALSLRGGNHNNNAAECVLNGGEWGVVSNWGRVALGVVFIRTCVGLDSDTHYIRLRRVGKVEYCRENTISVDVMFVKGHIGKRPTATRLNHILGVYFAVHLT